ncbi:response regulator transcription factor [Cohnella cellulosilytica]|uniref:Response regulator n=1 Tax=Cohnella cellulosilytica TaxID=986710 RepID=A0ABW2FKI0_9BACL
MLKVMVVDDDYLVRQGIIRVMPWERYGMEVTCEASNGEEALETMAATGVDLLVTDLAMPGMSGLELIKRVKERYPHVHMVVLTFHHEFELVKDALRLGVLDYITKVELEDDRLASILERIADRIRSLPPGPSAGAERDAEGRLEEDEVYASFRVRGQERRWNVAETAEAAAEDGINGRDGTKGMDSAKDRASGGVRAEGISGADGRDGAKAPDAAAFRGSRHPLDGAVVKLRGVSGMAKPELLQKLQLRGENELFYGAEDGARQYEWPIALLMEEPAASREEIVQLGLGWSGLSWMTDADEFARLAARTAALKLPAAQLEQMMYVATEEWVKVCDPQLLRFDEPDRPQTWREWLARLRDIRANATAQANREAYSPAIVASIFKAADYVKQHRNEDLQLPDIARKVNMSRSYFSKCFRDITGRTFQEYVRDCRIERAGQLLRHTSKPVSWIASESGYPNERYFSKVFRETTGELPRDYRRKHLKSHN